MTKMVCNNSVAGVLFPLAAIFSHAMAVASEPHAGGPASCAIAGDSEGASCDTTGGDWSLLSVRAAMRQGGYKEQMQAGGRKMVEGRARTAKEAKSAKAARMDMEVEMEGLSMRAAAVLRSAERSKAWRAERLAAENATTEAQMNFQRFIQESQREGDACSARLLQTSNSMRHLVKRAQTLGMQVDAAQMDLESEAKNLKTTEAAIKAAEENAEEDKAICTQTRADAEKELTRLQAELDELDDIAHPSVMAAIAEGELAGTPGGMLTESNATAAASSSALLSMPKEAAVAEQQYQGQWGADIAPPANPKSTSSSPRGVVTAADAEAAAFAASTPKETTTKTTTNGAGAVALFEKTRKKAAVASLPDKQKNQMTKEQCEAFVSWSQKKMAAVENAQTVRPPQGAIALIEKEQIAEGGMRTRTHLMLSKAERSILDRSAGINCSQTQVQLQTVFDDAHTEVNRLLAIKRVEASEKIFNECIGTIEKEFTTEEEQLVPQREEASRKIQEASDTVNGLEPVLAALQESQKQMLQHIEMLTHECESTEETASYMNTLRQLIVTTVNCPAIQELQVPVSPCTPLEGAEMDFTANDACSKESFRDDGSPQCDADPIHAASIPGVQEYQDHCMLVNDAKESAWHDLTGQYWVDLGGKKTRRSQFDGEKVGEFPARVGDHGGGLRIQEAVGRPILPEFILGPQVHSQLTIAIWVKFNGFGFENHDAYFAGCDNAIRRASISKAAGSHGSGDRFVMGTGENRIFFSDIHTRVNELMHVTFVWDNGPRDVDKEAKVGKVKVYLNGGSATQGAEQEQATNQMFDGHWLECHQTLALGGTKKQGSGVYELYRYTVFNRAKTADEVKTLYENTRPPEYNTEVRDIIHR